MVQLLDTNKDGVIDLEEYLAVEIEEPGGAVGAPTLLEGRYEEIFRLADLDDDGKLCARDAEFSMYLAGAGMRQARSGKSELDFSLGDAEQSLIRVDVDGDMKMSRTEWQRWMYAGSRRLGFGDELLDPAFQEFCEGFFSIAEVSGDGKLDIREFCFAAHMAEKVARQFSSGFADMLMKVGFEEADLDGDGTLDADEIEAIVQHAAALPGDTAGDCLSLYFAWVFDVHRGVTPRGPPPTPGPAAQHQGMAEEIRRLIAESDADGDGRLDRRECVALLTPLIWEQGEE